MKQTMIRLLLFMIFFLLLHLLLGQPMHEAILNGFVLTYIFEPAVNEALNK